MNPLTVLQIILLLLLISTLGIKTIISSSQKAVKELRKNNIQQSDAVLLSGLLPVLGISLGVALICGLFNPLLILTLAGAALPFATMLFSYEIKRRKQIREQRQHEQYLIEP